MLKSLNIRNLTAFAEADLEFSPQLNVIVGENAVGKCICSRSLMPCSPRAPRKGASPTEGHGRKRVSRPNLPTSAVTSRRLVPDCRIGCTTEAGRAEAPLAPLQGLDADFVERRAEIRVGRLQGAKLQHCPAGDRLEVPGVLDPAHVIRIPARGIEQECRRLPGRAHGDPLDRGIAAGGPGQGERDAITLTLLGRERLLDAAEAGRAMQVETALALGGPPMVTDVVDLPASPSTP